MRKIKSIGFIAILVFICIGLLIPAYNYYAPATERPAYTCQQYQDDTIRIAMIGDSWVFFHYQYNDTLVDLINQKTGKPVKVSAYGLCGKTSKEIYQSFFDDQIMKALLEHGADYCFISVGINDTYKKMGARYFSKSLRPKGRAMLNRFRFVFVCRRDGDMIRFYDVVNNNYWEQYLAIPKLKVRFGV